MDVRTGSSPLEEDRRTLAAWAILVGATLSSYAIGAEQAIDSTRVVAALVIGIGVAKVWLVAWRFMEIDRAPHWLRITIGTYCLGLFTLLMAVYLLA
ncbi:hypothetical protein GCM10009547_13030 [Sporichthya brevicatena]|jgi:hypothetical protein|uniref:Cytochrome c oxidase subunit IV n=1 Tax=Sporichthya brevicatena TaxID=171442 RepID=A0ABP3RKQ4_9ACTN